MTLLDRVGERTLQRVRDTGYALGYLAVVLSRTFQYIRRGAARSVLTFQILFTGVEALPVISVLALALGAIIVVQGVALLPQFGQGQLVYAILITAITRELGPILTSFIVAARSGTAIATELGNMVVSHEIEAYVASGIDPVSYLVVPRFLGVTISVVLLNIYFNLFGLLGSYIVTSLVTTVGFQDYLANLFNALTLADILVSLIKSALSGAAISVVATFYGFKVQQASTEVPVMAIKSVGQGFVLLVVVNAVVTVVYYLVV